MRQHTLALEFRKLCHYWLCFSYAFVLDDKEQFCIITRCYWVKISLAEKDLLQEQRKRRHSKEKNRCLFFSNNTLETSSFYSMLGTNNSTLEIGSLSHPVLDSLGLV
jgi:hypothetical protein